jgi:hypothetical protein
LGASGQRPDRAIRSNLFYRTSGKKVFPLLSLARSLPEASITKPENRFFSKKQTLPLAAAIV